VTIEQLHALLSAGLGYGASDIHFKPGDPPAYRVHGQLASLRYDKLKASDTRAICEHIVKDPEVLAKLGEIQEYDTSLSLPGVGRFRVNIYRQRGSLSLVLRIIPMKVPTLDDLGLPAVTKTIAQNERGLVLVTGATGSGKSSTLAAMIDQINRARRAHILTIEDPIEFLHRDVMASLSQREIGSDTRSYAVALRAALRQDPDVLMIGEMRDTESIDIALKASETGHMVYSTVHTTDAAKTIGRLVSVFPSEEQQSIRYRLADNLKATISQRLLRRTDGKGRVVAAEVMVVTSTIREYIRDPARTGGIKELIEKGKVQYEMQSFDQHLAALYQDGKIRMETALENASNPADLERVMRFES
jgi:twitching motility protein PilT